MNIVKIKDHDKEGGMSQADALAAAKEKGVRLLTNKEIDAILQDKKLYDEYYAFLPCWTGTRVEYKGTDCKVIEHGKTHRMKMPEKDGWYEVNEFGLPFGKPSESSNPNARYLWRIGEYSGLLSRWGDWCYDDGRRVVLASVRYVRLGVLGVKKEKEKEA